MEIQNCSFGNQGTYSHVCNDAKTEQSLSFENTTEIISISNIKVKAFIHTEIICYLYFVTRISSNNNIDISLNIWYIKGKGTRYLNKIIGFGPDLLQSLIFFVSQYVIENRAWVWIYSQ